MCSMVMNINLLIIKNVVLRQTSDITYSSDILILKMMSIITDVIICYLSLIGLIFYVIKETVISSLDQVCNMCVIFRFVL